MGRGKLGQADVRRSVHLLGYALGVCAFAFEEEGAPADSPPGVSGSAGGVEKGGLAAELKAVGGACVSGIAWGDEMRVGLIGQVRRVWAPRGVKVRQRVERQYEWAYLNLAVNGVEGKLYWCWTPNMKQGAVVEVVREWRERGIEVLIWDRAPSHRSRQVREVGVRLIEQPAYSPELNPSERVFEELRRRVEGRVYGDLEKKKAAIEEEIERLAADPERVRSLASWAWIREAVNNLSIENTAFQ